jgi:Spy/CpxP family protein refolding chaperone
MRALTMSLAVAATLALSSTFAATQAAMRSGNPPHPSTKGLMNRAPEVRTHGANQQGFCPPGQHKKLGNGSAFHC